MSTTYIAVFHRWFSSNSEGFHVELIDAASLKEAELIADAKSYRRSSYHCHVACKLIALREGQQLADRKLTWRERITGKLKG